MPKSILKSSTYHSNNLFRTKSPELEGLKLIKSVLKKESEELQQQASNTCDITTHSSNLRSSDPTSSDKCDSNYNNEQTANDDNTMESKNVDVKEEKYEERDDPSSRDFYHLHNLKKEDDKGEEGISGEMKKEHTVPCLTKKLITQDKSFSRSRTNFNLDEIDNIKIDGVISQICNSNEDKRLPKIEIPRSSDDEASSSGGREVRGIIKNDAIFRRRQNALTKQAK